MVQVVDDEVTISALHPKTGTKGKANLDKDLINFALNKANNGRVSKNRIFTHPDHDKKSIAFEEEQEAIKKEQQAQKEIHTI